MRSRPGSVDLAAMREEYSTVGINEALLPPEPFTLWTEWMADAVAAGISEPNAMVIATVASSANFSSPPQPSSRTVLCKGTSRNGFEFYTNYRSRKSEEIKASGTIAATFPWHGLHRQVNIVGRAEQTTSAESDQYWASRERGSQVGAWASSQSETIESYAELEDRYNHFDNMYPGAIPRPPHWGGWRILPESIEFWQGRLNRLHDRIFYKQVSVGQWERTRLSP